MLHRLVIVVLIMAGLILPEFEIVMGAEFKLGLRFQDADSDMVADTPSDPAKQVDPSTLIFAYTPVEDPAVYAKAWSKPAVPTSFLPRVADEGGGGTIGTFGTIGTVI